MTERIKDKIPLNKQAAIVTGSGEHFESKRPIIIAHWEICPPLRKPGQKDQGEDLRGYRFGFFSVVGIYAFKGSGDMRLWVVRCACGHFETRKTKAIKNPKNKFDRCENCRRVSYSRGERFDDRLIKKTLFEE